MAARRTYVAEKDKQINTYDTRRVGANRTVSHPKVCCEVTFIRGFNPGSLPTGLGGKS